MENILAYIWKMMNTPAGVAFVASILVTILGKIFTAKPAWKKLVTKYGPSLMAAVKYAEKSIPDNTESKGLRRLDVALCYVIDLEPKLKTASADNIKNALTAVHTQAETNGNLKKE